MEIVRCRAPRCRPQGEVMMASVEQVVEVRQRLAHAHEDEVVDAFAAEHFRRQDLARDFRGIEVPREPGEARGAELAAVGATDL